MRIIKQILLIYFVVILMPSQVNAWFWGGLKKDQLVSVNDQIYTADDFRNWWEIWKEEDTLFPESMDEFVNWHLLVQEAKYMELDLQPSYKQKLDVFLSARTRSLLKMDEIDSKIDISEEDIFEKYLQDYSPIWDTRLIYFIDEQSAQEAYRRIVAEDYDVDKILKNHTELTGFSGIDSKKLRPVSFASNEQLLEIFKNLEKEKVSSPFAYGKFYIVAHLFEIIIEEDSSNIPPAVRKKIKKDLHKIKSTELTRSFLEMLKTKYKVQLDDDLILGLDPQNTTETQMEKTFIKTTIGDFPLRILVDDLKRNKDINSPGLSPEKNKEIRYNMINYILFDVLSKRESLDRHYEKVPPFKWQYEYYTQHRLIKEFEANILGDLAIVSADEIIEYYTSHLNDYTPSGQINFAILWDEDDLADKIIIDFSRGEDFFSVARKYYHQEIPIQSTSEHTLDPEIAPILAELTSGEVSDLVKFKGKMCFIKMINKKLPSPAPLVDIKEEITKKLHQDKLSQQRSSYINTLREKSKIKINEALWLSLRKEFIGDSRESNVN